MALTSLRSYISALRSLDEIQDISLEVDLNLEMGAVIRRCYEIGAPAPLFQNIRGAAKGFRALGAPAGLSQQAGLRLARAALSLELDPRSSGQAIVERLASGHGRQPVAPVVVDDAPCFQNTFTGADVDITRLPCPLLHDGDGGRYLNTYGCTVVRTPDGMWTNWSTARIMTLDSTRMTGLIAPEQHLGVVRQAWTNVGKPMPFAVAIGVEPSIPFVCGMPLPDYVDEAGYLGAMMGRAIETVRCRTVDLEAPASAEILIEGFVALEETAPEGPMGEFAGYLWPGPGMPQPVYHVTALSYRNDPILPVVVAGEPVEENHIVWGTSSAAQILCALRDANLPVTTAWIPFEAALHWLVVTVPRDWKRRSGAENGESFCRRMGEVVFGAKAGAVIPKVIVSPDDIDPANINEVVWAFATRCHPTVGNALFDSTEAAPLLAYLTVHEKKTATTAKAVYNCLPPQEWGDRLPQRSSFRHCYPAETVERVLTQWKDYGFP